MGLTASLHACACVLDGRQNMDWQSEEGEEQEGGWVRSRRPRLLLLAHRTLLAPC